MYIFLKIGTLHHGILALKVSATLKFALSLSDFFLHNGITYFEQSAADHITLILVIK